MSTVNRARIAALVNSAMRRFGFQIVRADTLARMSMAESDARKLRALESRIEAIERQSDQAALKDIISYAMKAHWRTVDLIEHFSGTEDPHICPLCGHAGEGDRFERIESDCLFFGGRLVRHRCPHCEVIFGPQKMLLLDEQMLDLEYRNLYRMYAESDSTPLVVRAFHLLSPEPAGTYLDFGCGGEWSASVAKLRNEGWNIYGFEPSAKNSSEHVFATWQEVETRQFDGILSHNVLEHLFDPVGTTSRLARLLRPGGRLVHATPCFEYAYEYSRFHVYFFTGRSPEVLAERAQMEIVKWDRDGQFIACVMAPKESVRSSA